MQYSTRDVASLLGLSVEQVRSFARAGVLDAARGPRNEYRFDFPDLVLLRAARALLDAQVPHGRIVRALRRLRAQLPAGRSLSGLRLSVAGDSVVVSDGGALWDPESGQIQLDFSVDELEAHVAELTAAGDEPAAMGVAPIEDRGIATLGEPGAAEWFRQAVEQEATEPDQARRSYERALSAQPDHVDAHINLGRLLHEARNFKDAERHYRRALAITPNATAAYNLGIALEDQRRWREAVDAYTRALDLDPALADAHFNLSRLYERIGNEQAAFQHLRTYRALMRRGGGRGG